MIPKPDRVNLKRLRAIKPLVIGYQHTEIKTISILLHCHKDVYQRYKLRSECIYFHFIIDPNGSDSVYLQGRVTIECGIQILVRCLTDKGGNMTLYRYSRDSETPRAVDVETSAQSGPASPDTTPTGTLLLLRYSIDTICYCQY